MTFEFVPGVQVSPVQLGEQVLRLSVYDDAAGRLYDQIAIKVTLVDSARKSVPVDRVTLQMNPRRDRLKHLPDFNLHITEENRKGFTVTLVPVSKRVKDAVGDLLLDTDKNPRTFHIGPEASDVIAQLGITGFARMSALSLQGALASALKPSGKVPVISKDSITQNRLTTDEANKVSALIAQYGKTLHRLLFCHAHTKALCSAIARIEALAADAVKDDAAPMRLAIMTDVLSLPWQYLHAAGKGVNPDKFWGHMFSLNVQRATAAPLDTPEPSAMERAKKVMFARYAVETDDSYEFATEQINSLTRVLSPPQQSLVEVRSRDQMMTALSAPDRNQLGAIITFLHARAGLAISPGFGAGATMSAAAEGPILQFAPDDALSSAQLALLIGSESSGRYFPGAPLIILNACETGPSGLAMPHVSFQDALFVLGARGAIVTEVPVWIRLGHDMASAMIEHLGAGQSAPDALLRARLLMLKQHKNPLGLLYAYYGEPDVFLRR
ncbi:MAG: CHAT domain-containing protein [Hydrogenophaga sp.]|uniref:CHAT domain-containing protein n=1 Tax=Hydrogenophaga sp. TaxID=1904254 RepID=UPI0027329EDA|nr:CHAT domain-containing protein [Hydrogenophaga sp.]MDP3347429.1 CHAT domain-containing protein [Hydrogenophaga sp.]